MRTAKPEQQLPIGTVIDISTAEDTSTVRVGLGSPDGGGGATSHVKTPEPLSTQVS
jgi:hypothetical protein